MFNIDQLLMIEDSIKDELPRILTLLNRTGQINKLLDLIGMNYLIEDTNKFKSYKNGKVLVLGQSDAREKELKSTFKKMGFSEKRLELYINYDDPSSYNLKKLQYNPTYSVILVGKMPHKGKAIGDSSSIITYLENTEGYPPVIRLGSNSLKITKTNFKEALRDILDKRIVTVC
ncbi:MAG: hypothetical protein SPG00_03690 [Holdemanella porci]|nr:hypothetical protein [Holdemanella porci]